MDEPLRLQGTRGQGDRAALDAEHLREELVGQVEMVGTRAVSSAASARGSTPWKRVQGVEREAMLIIS